MNRPQPARHSAHAPQTRVLRLLPTDTASAVAHLHVPRESRLLVGGHSWRVEARSCTVGERRGGAAPALTTRTRLTEIGRSVHAQRKSPHQRDASPIRCQAVVRCARCGLLRSWLACLRVANARACHCACYLLEGGAARALATRAHCAAMGVVGPPAIKSHCTSGGALPFAARPWRYVPGAASRTAGFRVANARRATALAISWEEPHYARLRPARAAPQWVRSVHAHEKPPHQRRGSPIRCSTVVRCARYGHPHSWLSRGKRTVVPLRLLSLGRRRTTRACGARAPRRNGVVRSTRYEKATAPAGGALLFAAIPWYDVPGATSA